MLEIMDDIGEEESWIKLSIKDPKNLENACFADIEGRFRWWRKVGSFKGLTRPKDLKENLWLVNGVTWSALADVDDEEEEKPHLSDDSDDPYYDSLSRATNDFGLACLVTLDSAGNPFLEMLYNTGKSDSEDPSHPEYVKIIWKKQKEGCRGLLMLSNGEARRLGTDGAADLSETRGDDWFIETREDDWFINKDNCADADTEDEDTQGDLDEEVGVNNSNSQKNLKRQAGEDDEGLEVKRHKTSQ